MHIILTSSFDVNATRHKIVGWFRVFGYSPLRVVRIFDVSKKSTFQDLLQYINEIFVIFVTAKNIFIPKGVNLLGEEAWHFSCIPVEFRKMVSIDFGYEVNSESN